MLESCLSVMLAIVGTKWENVEHIKTLVCALLTWQQWHSRTPGCIHNEQYGEAMLSRLCAQCPVWSTITFVSGTLEVFVSLAQTQRGRKHLSLTDKCVQRYGSNLKKFIFNVFMGNLPIVRWQPPPLRIVEVVALHTVDALFFLPLRLFLHEAPYLLFSTNMFGLSYVRTHQAMILCNYYNKQCHRLQSSGNTML